MKPQITVYGALPYDRGAKVRWLLSALELDYKTVWLSSAKKENETPEYLKLNPMGNFPTLVIDGMSMFESGAVCMYLADKFSSKGFAPAFDSPLRADYLKWMFFATATLDAIQIRVMVIEDMHDEARKIKEERLFSDMRDAAYTLNEALINKDYLVGNKFSAADICMGYHLYFLMMWPELAEIIQEFPVVTKYLEKLRKDPAAIKAEVFTYEE